MASISIGVYYPIRSFIHRLDARIKIILMITITITLFFVNAFGALFFLLLFYFIAFLISGLPVSWAYKAIRPVFTILFIAVFFQVLFTPGADILFRWGIFVISLQGIIFGLKVITKIIILVGFSSILSFTTTPIELTDAIESLLAPLKLLRLPVSEIALVMAIALRFVPQILTQAHDLVKAQKGRGARFDSGGLLKRGQALISLFIPLFVTTFKTAEDLGRAMEARAYQGGKGRTHFRERRLKNSDYLTFVATLIILTIAILLGQNG